MLLVQEETLKNIEHHYKMLDTFSFHYEEIDTDTFWFMRTWPLRIQACLTDGKNMMADKNDIFSAKLEQEKEAFTKQILTFQANFDKIKQFNHLGQAVEWSADAFQLKEKLSLAFEKKNQFNERETLFGLPETPYPELHELSQNFQPFYDLTTLAFLVDCDFKDWTQNQLMRIPDPNKIFSSVTHWHQ